MVNVLYPKRTANFRLQSFSTTFAPLPMQVHHNIDQITSFRNAVVTIGTFDGVHSGHRQILNQLKQEAVKINGETVIITFHPHPRKVVHAGQSPVFLINTIEEKISLLEQVGIDHLVIVPFTEAFSQLTAKEYVEDFLINKFHPNTVIIGYDHHFGKGRGGNYRLLEEYSAAGAFMLKEIPEHLIHHNIVSSTAIRQAVLGGNIEEAKELLGYNFFFEGTVIEGNKLGKVLGFPTANLRIENEDKLIPGNGVYAIEAKVVNNNTINRTTTTYPPLTILHSNLYGMMNIGNRPTVGGTHRAIEVNIFDFNEDIYGQIVQVSLKKFLRKEKKFEGLEELKRQLRIDKKEALQMLS